MRTLHLALPLAALLAFPVASSCGGCNPSTTDDDDGGSTVVPSDGGGTVGDGGETGTDGAVGLDGAVAPDAATGQLSLTFEDVSPLEVHYGTTRDLNFKVSRGDGTGVPDVLVYFEPTGSGGLINVARQTTNASGIALIRFTAGMTDGDTTLVATTDQTSSVTVVLQVRNNPFGGLTVHVSSNTRIPLQNSEMLVWVHPTAPPTCAFLATATSLPTATQNAEYPTLPGQTAVPHLATGSHVTLLAHGFGPHGQTVGYACNDTLVISGGSTTPVNLVMEQQPAVHAGEYDVLMHFNLGNALPHPYDTVLGYITDLLSDPVGYVVYQVLVLADAQLGSHFVDWNAALGDGGMGQRQATFSEVRANTGLFNTWREARAILDDQARQRWGQKYDDLMAIGPSIALAITDFEVGARYRMVAPTTAAGRYRITESWQAMVYNWGYGCPGGDLGCARRAVLITDPALTPTATTYGVDITHAPLTGTGAETERFKVEPDLHDFMLRYGAVILLALNNVVFPNLPEGIAAPNLAGVLINLVDCAAVGTWVANYADPIGDAATFEGLCVQGIQFGASEIESQLLDLAMGGGGAVLVGKEEGGVAAGGVFYLVDQDHDLTTELVRELQMNVSWQDPQNPATAQDISAPITGDGRLKAAACQLDSECKFGRVCAPVPHYLKVKKVEMDCRYTVGDGEGREACTQDAQCKSGLCVGLVRPDGGAGSSGFCYVSCNGNNTCPGGTCNATGANVNLNPTLQGLGTAPAACCVGP